MLSCCRQISILEKSFLNFFSSLRSQLFLRFSPLRVFSSWSSSTLKSIYCYFPGILFPNNCAIIVQSSNLSNLIPRDWSFRFIDRFLFKTLYIHHRIRPILSFRNRCYSRTTREAVSSLTFRRHLQVKAPVCLLGRATVKRIARSFGSLNDNVTIPTLNASPLGIHILFTSTEWGKGSKVGRVSKRVFASTSVIASNKDRRGRSRSLSCKTEGRPPRIINQSETFSLGRTTMRTASRDAWNIDPSDSRFFFFKKKNPTQYQNTTLFFPFRKWNVIFYSIRGGKFSFANDVLESSSNIWRTSCLPNRVSTLCCIYFAI